MNSARPFTLKFYLPILVGGFLILILIVSPKFVTTDAALKLRGKVSVIGIELPLGVWLEHRWIVRAVLIVAAVVSFGRAAAIDFSKFFPDRIRMDVYFDYKGIKRNLNRFSAGELAEMNIAPDWKGRIQCYDDAVKRSLVELWRRRRLSDVPDVADFSRDLLHARGETSFVVERVGLISYRITTSNGFLDYGVDVPHKSPRQFRGSFQLRETPYNHLRPDVWKLLRRPCFLLKPEFKQIFSFDESGPNAAFDHVVVGVTKILLLPFPSFSNTVYVWKQSDETVVPIAYCVYY